MPRNTVTLLSLWQTRLLMPILHRYLLRQFLITLVFTCGAVTIVGLFSQSFRLLAMVINNAAGVWAFLQLAFWPVRLSWLLLF